MDDENDIALCNENSELVGKFVSSLLDGSQNSVTKMQIVTNIAQAENVTLVANEKNDEKFLEELTTFVHGSINVIQFNKFFEGFIMMNEDSSTDSVKKGDN